MKCSDLKNKAMLTPFVIFVKKQIDVDLFCSKNMRLNVLPISHLAGLLIVMLLGLQTGCKERLPMNNSAPYWALHGIVNDGKTINKITLVNDRNSNRPQLKFPADISVAVDTDQSWPPISNHIKKGFANQASISLDFTKDKKLVASVPFRKDPALGLVRIYFIASLGPASVERTEKYLAEITQQSLRTTDKPDWELREYLPTITGNITEFVYVPFDENFKSMDGDRMSFGCGVTSVTIDKDLRPAGCASHFKLPGGLSVTYAFESDLLPYWRDLHKEVVQIAESLLVNNNSH